MTTVTMDKLPQIMSEALSMLQHELNQDSPCVARCSIVMGVLQERLFTKAKQQDSLQPEVEAYMNKFQELFVQPAAAKLGKCKTPQEKVVAIAKFLRGKLAKAPAHKQPLHTQYLPSALKDGSKRQLDCLGIATAVLALCQQISQQYPQQHADLAASSMVVSDDHCWLSLPSADGNAVLQIEVTDPREIQTSDAANWLYAGGHGMTCSPASVVMILVAGMMPEELKDDAAAEHVRRTQLHLLQLAEQFPQAMFYSNYFRWGMLHEEYELDQLAAAAESGNMQMLQQLALQGCQQVQSQQYYARSQQSSNGWQWHPSSCAAFGWLNRMQAALCGDTDNLLALQPVVPAVEKQGAAEVQPEGQKQAGRQQADAAAWLSIGTFLLEQALLSVQDCTRVLQKYSGCAGKPGKAADQQLLEAVRDLWQNLADACKAVACLQQLQQHEVQQKGSEQGQLSSSTQPAAADGAANGLHGEATACEQHAAGYNITGESHHQEQPRHSTHAGADVPAAAPATGHTVHLGAAVSKANLELKLTEQLSNSSWLQTLVQFMDALCAYYGDESADLPANIVAYFVEVAQTFTRSARAEAVESQAGQLQSTRIRALADVGTPSALAWQEVGVDLQQLVQMPSSRKRKRKEY